MCGIFGLHFFDTERHVDLPVVKSATDTMYHRGPDDSGYFAERNTGLGHRRLSIIDLSSGHQPMMNEDGRVVVVYNGEIYNYSEIKRTLIDCGHVFRTDCDTEVIVHAYEEWGTDCVQKFIGMFAFVLLDKGSQRLWVVRDRLGIKPLYFYHDREVFIAASEVKAILKTGFVASQLNETVLDAYFSVGYVPGPETMFRSIYKLQPGHFLLIENNQVRDYEYWDFSSVAESQLTQAEAFEQIDALLEDCVSRRLISDVPVGAFLSGGLDSSFVVGKMDALIRPQSVNTFTVAYNQGFSEHDYAKIVSDRFKTNHYEFFLEPDDFFSSLKTLVQYAEEPIVEPAAIALYHIAKLAREHAIVLLSGEGSDENFAGYYLYQFMAKLENAQGIIPGALSAALPFLGQFAPKLKYRKYLDWAAMPLAQRYRGTSTYLSPSLKKYLYRPEFNRLSSTYLDDQFSQYFNKVKHKDPVSQMLYVDAKTWLVDDLLVKADKMTMAASTELRVPFLDHRLIEAVSALPVDYKIKDGQGKYLLKKISEKMLPSEIIYREKKGFPVPTKEWFGSDLIDRIGDVLGDIKKESWFRPDALDSVLVAQKTGKEDHSRFLMTLLVLNEWRNQYA